MSRLARLLLLVQALLLLFALVWGALREADRFWLKLPLTPAMLWGPLLGVGLVIVSIPTMHVMTRLFPATGWVLEGFLIPLLGPVSTSEIVLLSCAAGFCEESLFRGVMVPDPNLGLVVSSVLFGVLHTGDRRLLPMGVWSMLVGLLLGGIFKLTGNLWIPILAHATNNILAMLYLRREYRQRSARPGRDADDGDAGRDVVDDDGAGPGDGAGPDPA